MMRELSRRLILHAAAGVALTPTTKDLPPGLARTVHTCTSIIGPQQRLSKFTKLYTYCDEYSISYT